MGAPAQVLRAARFYMAAQIETGHLCPVTMTHAAVAALTLERELVAKLMPKITSRRYDPRFRPWWEKRGMRKQVRPPGACASTRKASHMGADMNHLWPVIA